jgi:hypothetical protein
VVALRISSRILALLAILILFLSMFLSLATRERGWAEQIYIGEKTTHLRAVADAYVTSGSPDSNYGGSTLLMAEFNSKSTYIYVTFDLSSIRSDAVITSADFRLYLTDISASGKGTLAVGAHHCEDTSWNELTITWNNKPQFAEKPTDTNGFGAWPIGWVNEGYKSWAVTNDVRASLADGRLTEVLRWEPTTGSGIVRFSSNEGPKTEYPEMEIKYVYSPFYKLQIGSVQDTGETSNLGSVTIEGEGSFDLPIEVFAMPGTYKVTYNGGYEFLRWETHASLGLSDHYAKQMIMKISGDSILTAVGSGERIEYRGIYTPLFSPNASAMRFTPSLPGQLEEARFRIDSAYASGRASEGIVAIYVNDSAREYIVPPINATIPVTTYWRWVNVDLSTYYIGVSPGVDFYIGLVYQKPWYSIHVGVIQAIVKLSPTTEISIQPQPSTVTLGEPVAVSGSVSPPFTGVTLTLTYTRPDRTWVKRNVTTTSGGSFNDTYSPDKAGNWTVLASEYKTVSRPAAFTVKEKPATVAKLESTQIVVAAMVILGILLVMLLVRRRHRLTTPRLGSPVPPEAPWSKKYCPQCGHAMPQSQKYCDRCGRKQDFTNCSG